MEGANETGRRARSSRLLWQLGSSGLANLGEPQVAPTHIQATFEVHFWIKSGNAFYFGLGGIIEFWRLHWVVDIQ